MPTYCQPQTRLDRFCWFVSVHRITVLALIVLITAIFAYGATKIKSEVRIFELMPYDHPYQKLHAKFAEIFGTGGSGVIIALKARQGDIFNTRTLNKLKHMTEEVSLWDEVYRTLTTSIASYTTKVVKTKAKGVIVTESLMFPDIPRTEQEMIELKKNIFSDPSKSGVLVSEDGTAALLITEFKEEVSYKRSLELLQTLREKYSDDQTSVHIVGYPMLMGWVYSLAPQMYMVFGMSIVAIILVLILIFRNFQGMFSPVVNAFILTIWGLGFTGFSGINFNPMLYVLAFLVGSRMIGNSHQIAYRYFEELDASGGDRLAACYETTRTMWIPNLAAVLADVAGFTVLILAKIILMQYLAVIMSFWMATILLTGFLVPAVCSIFPFKVDTSEWKKETCQTDWMARLMIRITNFSISPGTRYVTGGIIVVLAALCLYEMSQLKIGDPETGSSIFYHDHPFNQDTALINERFKASSENLALYYEGEEKSIYDPAVLATFEKFNRYMAAELPDIYKYSSSIIDIGKTLNLTLHDGDPIWYQLYRNEEQLMGLLGYVRTSLGTANLLRFADPTLERAQINLFFSDHTSDNLLRIRDAAYGFFKDNASKTGRGEFLLAGGRIGMEIAVNEEMKRAHLLIDLSVYAAIFLLCSLCFRSMVAGLMLTLPLILANAMCFSYMSLRNIGLSINTLPVAAIGAGLGVDFAIYLYSRCMEEFSKEGADWRNTIMQSICTCGKAIVYTGVTVILPIITWYFFSDMKFQAEVGFFLSIIMGINVILALTLHPLLIYIIKPKFIQRKYSEEQIPSRFHSIGRAAIGG
ncbi:MAG: MMPL family transporter [Desulfatitalea sp.]|nr:MMPL family transporter [Desulfatitalea sp.]NNK01612.1 MMPL family transporter [Desulfatitalea sp.]